MIAQTLQSKIGEAMKARDTVRLSVLRMLSSAFNYKKIDVQHDLTDEEEIAVIKKEAKQRRDSIEAYEKAGRGDLAESEKAELVILQEFLPPEMPEEELNKIVDEVTSVEKNLGKAIGLIKARASSVDGGKIAELVRQKLV